MFKRRIHIFEFPTNLGLRKESWDDEPGVKLLPEWFKKHAFHKKINAEQIVELNPPKYSTEMDGESGVLNADLVINFAKQQSELVRNHFNGQTFDIVLGGDCSILVGNAMALKRKGNYGLFFLDGHTDYLLPKHSASKQVAAMELAIVTGLGHDKLTNIQNLKPYFEEVHVWCVGNRELDTETVETIEKSKIKYFDLNRLRKVGAKKCTSKFLRMVEKNDLDGFLIHLDADVLNDEIMPAVDARQPDGLTYKELTETLIPLLSNPKAVGIEITILNPNLDKEGKHTLEFVNHLAGVINTTINVNFRP